MRVLPIQCGVSMFVCTCMSECVRASALAHVNCVMCTCVCMCIPLCHLPMCLCVHARAHIKWSWLRRRDTNFAVGGWSACCSEQKNLHLNSFFTSYPPEWWTYLTVIFSNIERDFVLPDRRWNNHLTFLMVRVPRCSCQSFHWMMVQITHHFWLYSVLDQRCGVVSHWYSNV